MRLVVPNIFRRNLLPLWMVALSFGPYVMASAGIRTEHVIIYGSALLALLVIPLRPRSLLSYRPVFSIFSLLAATTVWTLAVTLIGPRHFQSMPKMISYMENYTQPMAIMLVFGAFVGPLTGDDYRGLVRSACRLLVWLLVANSVLVLVSVFVDTARIVAPFVGEADRGPDTVSAVSVTMGRFSGIFNQPIESGMMYSLGLFAWACLTRTKRSILVLDWVILVTLVVGGALSVSKAFLLCGLPLFLWQWLSTKTLRRMLNWRFLVVASAGIAGIVALFQRWSGYAFLARLWLIGNNPGEPNLIALYTSHRFGKENSLVVALFSRVWRESPLYGLGFAAALTLDNAYAEFFVQGGLVGLCGYLLVLATMGWQALRYYRAGEENRMQVPIFLLIVLGGLGGPVLTMNRVSTVIWVLLMLIYSVGYAEKAVAPAAELGGELA